jgi:hypothetical protein
MWSRAVAVVVVLAGVARPEAKAQQQPIVVGSELEEYVRALQLQGVVGPTSFSIRSTSANQTAGFVADSAHPWDQRYPLNGGVQAASANGRLRAMLIDPEAHLIYNSAYPRGVSDGAIWAGKGGNASISGGIQVVWGPLTATLLPTVYYAQNRDFPIVPASQSGVSEYAYPWHGSRIDWPQRFGDEGFAKFDWGQSGVRVDLGAFSAGFGTENFWLGPAFRNGIIMGNSAPGFLHGDVGTGRPVWIAIGHLEVRAMFGRLVESDHFDTNPANDVRFLTGLALNYQPKWIPGLYLGAQRVLYQKSSTAGLDDVFGLFGPFFREATVLPDGGQVNDSTDQLLSLHARWLFPQVGFEAYVEYARNDFSGSLRDFLLEPDHSAGYTLGLHKTLPSGKHFYRLRAEATHLGRLLPVEVRASPTYYVHSLVHQGYTHRGQLLGADIGPGSNSEYISVDRFDGFGRIGVYFERIRYDDDAYFANFGSRLTRAGHDVELTFGISTLRFVGPLDVGAAVALSRDLNRDFQVQNDVTNINAHITLRWRHR